MANMALLKIAVSFLVCLVYPNNLKNWRLDCANALGLNKFNELVFLNTGVHCKSSNCESFHANANFSDCLGISSAMPMSASLDPEMQDIDLLAYSEIKKECYHFLYGIQRNLLIWGWPDSMVKQVLKENLEAYLIGYLNTPESRKVYLEYESIDWDLSEMMKPSRQL